MERRGKKKNVRKKKVNATKWTAAQAGQGWGDEVRTEGKVHSNRMGDTQ